MDKMTAAKIGIYNDMMDAQFFRSRENGMSSKEARDLSDCVSVFCERCGKHKKQCRCEK